MNITCIVCPLGCSIDIEEENESIVEINGYSCPRGKEFAESEFYNPKRVVTTIVAIDGGEQLYLPVISDGQVPKQMLWDCVELLKRTKVRPPIEMGDIVVEDILDTGINIISAKSIE